LLSPLFGSTEEAEMTTSAYFRNEKSLRRVHEGPLGIYVDQYAARMTVDGYGRQSGWYCLSLVSDFSRWLLRTQRGVRDVDEQAIVHYLTDRARDRRPGKADRSALKRLLTMLREADAIGPSAPATPNPHEQIFADFVEGSCWVSGWCLKPGVAIAEGL